VLQVVAVPVMGSGFGIRERVGSANYRPSTFCDILSRLPGLTP
jgi:hypothetical protein